MRRLRMCLPLTLLAACQTGGQTTHAEPELIYPEPFAVVEFEPPPGYPSVLGTATLVRGGEAQVFTTYDYSIGAFDASAWFDSEEGAPRFTLVGRPDANPDAETGKLSLTSHLNGGAAAGSAGRDPVIEIWLDGERRGAKLTSNGHAAVLVIDSFVTDSGATSGYGQASGHFSATLCPGAGDPALLTGDGECQAVSGSFDTRVQYSP